MKLRKLQGGGRLSIDHQTVKTRLDNYTRLARISKSWRKSDRLALYVVCLCDRYGMTLRDAAEVMGISKSYAGHLYQRKDYLKMQQPAFEEQLEDLDCYIIYNAKYIH